VGRNKDALAGEIFPVDCWLSRKLDLLRQPLVARRMVILILLHVDEWRLEVEIQHFAIVVLIHTSSDCTDIVFDIDYGKLFGVQVLDDDLRLTISLAIDGNEVFE